MINILKNSLTYEWWNGLAEFQPNRQYSKRVFNIDILGRKCCYKWYILTLFMRILTFVSVFELVDNLRDGCLIVEYLL